MRLASRDKPPILLGQIVAYYVLACVISWAWVIPFAATGHVVEQGQGWPTHFPSLLGPMLAAFIITGLALRRPGLRDLLLRMVRWKVGLWWWLAALSPLLFLAFALAGMQLAGQDLPALADFASFSGLSSGLGVIGVFLLIFLVNGFGEETGWRGFALPRLQQRFTSLVATLIVVALTAVWHIPQFFLLAASGHHHPPLHKHLYGGPRKQPRRGDPKWLTKNIRGRVIRKGSGLNWKK